MKNCTWNEFEHRIEITSVAYETIENVWLFWLVSGRKTKRKLTIFERKFSEGREKMQRSEKEISLSTREIN